MIARQVRADELRVTAAALGLDASGRKQDVAAALDAAMADTRDLLRRIRALPTPVRRRLRDLRRGGLEGYFQWSGTAVQGTAPDRALAAEGLLVPLGHHRIVPREVAAAAWLDDTGARLRGRPELTAAGTDPATLRPAADAAAHDLVRGVTALLDIAATDPVTALKRGGIGARERKQLAARLSAGPAELVLWIDLAHQAGLLAAGPDGYAPTDDYPAWREAEPAAQWAALACAWFVLDHAPTSRDTDGEKEQPPPLPLSSPAGGMRRAILSAAREGRSVRAAAAQVDWFFPLHDCPDEQRDRKAAAALHESELLGVTAADVLTELGEHLLAVSGEPPDGRPALLAARGAALVSTAPCSVILQSDLTAVVSGRPSVGLARLLSAAAVSEARGSATVWRFTPASVRGALDAGWRAADLHEQLAAVAEHGVPQPLTYLIDDVARRHGHVAVRGMRSGVIADEATATEILHTKALAALHLSRLAPTVLASPRPPDEVLTRLRAHGWLPMAQDAQGAVIVESRPEHRAPAPSPRAAAPPDRHRVPAADLARALLSRPLGSGRGNPDDRHPGLADATTADADSSSLAQLSALADRLDESELDLLADALDNGRAVQITYLDQNRKRSVRTIEPLGLYGPWLEAWCRLRAAERNFTVSHIESVGPA
jgi:hypothetical protein